MYEYNQFDKINKNKAEENINTKNYCKISCGSDGCYSHYSSDKDTENDTNSEKILRGVAIFNIIVGSFILTIVSIIYIMNCIDDCFMSVNQHVVNEQPPLKKTFDLKSIDFNEYENNTFKRGIAFHSKLITGINPAKPRHLDLIEDKIKAGTIKILNNTRDELTIVNSYDSKEDIKIKHSSNKSVLDKTVSQMQLLNHSTKLLRDKLRGLSENINRDAKDLLSPGTVDNYFGQDFIEELKDKKHVFRSYLLFSQHNSWVREKHLYHKIKDREKDGVYTSKVCKSFIKLENIFDPFIGKDKDNLFKSLIKLEDIFDPFLSKFDKYIVSQLEDSLCEVFFNIYDIAKLKDQLKSASDVFHHCIITNRHYTGQNLDTSNHFNLLTDNNKFMHKLLNSSEEPTINLKNLDNLVKVMYVLDKIDYYRKEGLTRNFEPSKKAFARNMSLGEILSIYRSSIFSGDVIKLNDPYMNELFNILTNIFDFYI